MPYVEIRQGWMEVSADTPAEAADKAGASLARNDGYETPCDRVFLEPVAVVIR